MRRAGKNTENKKIVRRKAVMRQGLPFSAVCWILLAVCLLAGCGQAPEQGKSRADASLENTSPAAENTSSADTAASSASGPSREVSAPAAQAASAAETALTAKTGSTVETASATETASAAGTSSAGQTAARTAAGQDREAEEPRMLKYIDAWKEWHTMEVDPTVRQTAYDAAGFVHTEEDPQWLVYEEKDDSGSDLYECLQGIDVSEHQGTIDWQAVAQAGYQFAFIRVGYRGYGEAGNLLEDRMAVENLQQAKAAGLLVGTYLFSQALNEEEAAEEAALAVSVIEKSGVETDLPLMYDPEIIKDDQGRANDITREQVALNTAAFRRAAEASSTCRVDIYSNLPWEHNYFDAETMNACEIWYADYEPLPQTPYHFTWWQYTNEGTVPGIDGPVDLNLWIRQK